MFLTADNPDNDTQEYAKRFLEAAGGLEELVEPDTSTIQKEEEAYNRYYDARDKLFFALLQDIEGGDNVSILQVILHLAARQVQLFNGKVIE